MDLIWRLGFPGPVPNKGSLREPRPQGGRLRRPALWDFPDGWPHSHAQSSGISSVLGPPGLSTDHCRGGPQIQEPLSEQGPLKILAHLTSVGKSEAGFWPCDNTSSTQVTMSCEGNTPHSLQLCLFFSFETASPVAQVGLKSLCS